VGKAHGIRGEVTVEVRTDDPDVRFALGAELATEPPERGPLTVHSARTGGGRLVVGFAGVADRSAAEQLRGTLLVVNADTSARSSDPDEFWDHELVGLAAVTAAGEQLGTVTEIVHAPGQDLLVLHHGDPPRELLLPFVAAIVPEVDLAAGRLLVDPPEGLLSL